jgi:hypothetical protein
VRFDPARSTCVAEDNVVQVPLRGMPYAWHSERRSGWPAYGISPVSTFPFYFWQFDNWVRICPGTPLNVSLPEFVENVRRDFEIVNFKVDEFRRPDFSSEGIKDDNGVRIGLEPPPRY